jgi:hypothetical protein
MYERFKKVSFLYGKMVDSKCVDCLTQDAKCYYASVIRCQVARRCHFSWICVFMSQLELEPRIRTWTGQALFRFRKLEVLSTRSYPTTASLSSWFSIHQCFVDFDFDSLVATIIYFLFTTASFFRSHFTKNWDEWYLYLWKSWVEIYL